MVLLALLVVLLALGGAGWVWWRGSIGTLPLRPHCTATALGRSTQLSPEQAGNAAIIAAVAVHRNLPGRAATIGIATAIQESKLVNLSGGDRDSLGLFQQRPSQGWGTQAQVQDPVYAAGRFFDHLVQTPGWDAGRLTDVAQAVQRSGFPEAYQQWEPMATELAAALVAGHLGALGCT